MIERMAKYAENFSESINKLYHSHRSCDPDELERGIYLYYNYCKNFLVSSINIFFCQMLHL